MEIESSLVAAQNALAVNPSPREPQREANVREQEQQRRDTELPRSQIVARQATPEAFAKAEKFQQQQQAFYQQSSLRARQAVGAYQNLVNAQQRSEIQNMMGIDTYA